MMNITNLAVLYFRQSTQEQVRENNSLAYQERICRQLCAERGWEVVAVFRDEGISAWKDVERPGFLKMVEYIRTSKNVNLVFLDYSRFGRRTGKALRVFEEILDKICFSIAAATPS